MSQYGQTHFKNLAAFAARFLKRVWPFWNIIHQRVKSVASSKLGKKIASISWAKKKKIAISAWKKKRENVLSIFVIFTPALQRIYYQLKPINFWIREYCWKKVLSIEIFQNQTLSLEKIKFAYLFWYGVSDAIGYIFLEVDCPELLKIKNIYLIWKSTFAQDLSTLQNLTITKVSQFTQSKDTSGKPKMLWSMNQIMFKWRYADSWLFC